MKRVRLIADDYALAPGVSAAIRDLLAWGRLSGTSVMAPSPELKEEAVRLLALSGPRPFEIGLHVTLTGGLAPLTDQIAPFRGQSFPQLAALLATSLTRVASRRLLAAEIAAQFEAFQGAFGRAPAFIDGHQHVHLLPIVRDIVLDLAAARAPGAWVRQCAPSGPMPALASDPKGALIAWLSRGLITRAARRGIATNPGFAGAYLFRRQGDYPELFRRFLASVPDGGVVMCHPGRVDAALRARDPVDAPRESEFAFLAGPGLPTMLAAADTQLM